MRFSHHQSAHFHHLLGMGTYPVVVLFMCVFACFGLSLGRHNTFAEHCFLFLRHYRAWGNIFTCEPTSRTHAIRTRTASMASRKGSALSDHRLHFQPQMCFPQTTRCVTHFAHSVLRTELASQEPSTTFKGVQLLVSHVSVFYSTPNHLDDQSLL